MSSTSSLELETSSHVLYFFPSVDGDSYYAIATKADRTGYVPTPLTLDSELEVNPVPLNDGQDHVLQVKLGPQLLGQVSNASKELDQLAQFTAAWNNALDSLKENRDTSTLIRETNFNPVSIATKLYRGDFAGFRSRSNTGNSSTSANPAAVISDKVFKRKNEFLVKKPISVRLATWNLHGELLQRVNLASFLGKPKKYDLYAICFQESDPLGPRNLTANLETLKSTQDAIISTLGGPRNYKIVSSHQLLGVMVLLIATADLEPYLSNARVDTTATGLLGIWGNKGAASIRVTLGADENASIPGVELAIIGCHLSAGEGKSVVSRRKWELGEIEKKMGVLGLLNTSASEMVFSDGIDDSDTDDLPPSPEQTEDISFVLGDLNYRVNMDFELAQEFSKNKEYETILVHDTLSQEMKERHIFTGFKEQDINFPPTYKYAIGTDSFDQSSQGNNKPKIPSYTDRILYTPHASLSPKEYTSLSEYSLSDHKPVVASFDLELSVVDQEKRKKVVESILKDSDTLENSLRPSIVVSPKELVVKDARVLEEVHGEISIRQVNNNSTENHPVHWEISLDSTEISVTPKSGVLPPGANVFLKFSSTVPIHQSSISAVAVLHVADVQDVFIPIEFQALPTCLGKSLSFLSRTPLGVRSGVTVTGQEEGASNMPREIYNCVNYLWAHAFADIFNPANKPEKSIQMQVQEWMDEGKDFDEQVLDTANKLEKNSGVYSVAQQLLLLLQNLDGGIVMTEYYPFVLRGREGAVQVSWNQ